jgi:hypothetical protein
VVPVFATTKLQSTNYKKTVGWPPPLPTKGLPGCDARHSSDDATLGLPQTNLSFPCMRDTRCYLSLSRERESSVVDLLREIYTTSTAPSPVGGVTEESDHAQERGKATHIQTKEPQAAYVTCSLLFSLPTVRSQKKSTTYFSTYVLFQNTSA